MLYRPTVAYCGAFSYADIILLCPSVKGTNEMLKLCQEYANNHFIKSNTAKSQVIVFPAKSDFKIENIFDINDSCIPVVSEVKHLGHVLSNTVNGYIDVNYIGSCFNKCVNIMMANLGSVSSCILGKLFITFFCSFYGIALCDVRSKSFKHLHILWRKAIRRIYRLPYKANHVLLPHILERPDFDVDIMKHIIKFYSSMLKSPNFIVHNLAYSCQ